MNIHFKGSILKPMPFKESQRGLGTKKIPEKQLLREARWTVKMGKWGMAMIDHPWKSNQDPKI